MKKYIILESLTMNSVMSKPSKYRINPTGAKKKDTVKLFWRILKRTTTPLESTVQRPTLPLELHTLKVHTEKYGISSCTKVQKYFRSSLV